MRWMPARKIVPRLWQIILGILCLSIIIGQFFRINIEPFQTKGDLYLLLEAPGFNIPELNLTKKIMDPAVAKAKFDKVVVVANAAKYKKFATDAGIMTDQWDNQLVKDLGLPVERWAFVCCDSPGLTATNLIDNLIGDFPDIKGFLIDSEDGSIPAFADIFKKKGSAYKYGIVGGLRNTIPPESQYGFVVDKFFSEVYTEGTNELDRIFYETDGKKVDKATCASMHASGVKRFWNGMKSKLGDSIVATVCGSGDCQESLYGSDCFDERLSDKNIDSLLNGMPDGSDFAIWYGTGQQFFCEPAKTCLGNGSADCGKNKKCVWSPYKKNPNTNTTGVCISQPGIWGCSTTW
jgi:hypothetical protein